MRFLTRKQFIQAFTALAMILGFMSCGLAQTKSSSPEGKDVPEEKKLETATLGGGCFWCLEAVYQRVIGVEKVVSGYTGGTVERPTYEAVCTGRTGHAEVCQITFDPSVISFEQLLHIFFKIHDPTTLNQQGADHGTQYRSAVFYDGDEQRETTEKVIKELTEKKAYRNKIVTEVTPLPDFYPAEAYHQNYFVTHPEAGYCQYTIAPKIEKFEKFFKSESKMQKEREAKKKKKS
jgi:peptide-methionine (S)-S-oxide reductase